MAPEDDIVLKIFTWAIIMGLCVAPFGFFLMIKEHIIEPMREAKYKRQEALKAEQYERSVEAERQRQIEEAARIEQQRALAVQQQEAEERERALAIQQQEAEERAFWNSPEGMKVRAAQEIAAIERQKAIDEANIRIAEQTRLAEIARQTRLEEQAAQEALIEKASKL